MANRADTLNVYVDADTRKLRQGYKKAEDSTRKFTKATNKLGDSLKSKLGFLAAGAGAAVLGRKLIDLASEATQLASDFDEASSKANVLFGPAAQNLIAEYERTASRSLGMSANAALEAATNYGQLLRSFGATEEQSIDLSKSLVKLSADLNSFSNRSDAAQAIFSGLSGEMEPLKKFGVTLLDTRIKAEAAAMGLEMVGGQLSPLNKALASYSLIMKDTAVAQDDFERTADGLANSTRILQGAVTNAKREIGEGFVFALTRAVEELGGADGLSAAIEDAGSDLGDFTFGLGVVTSELVKFNRQLAEATAGMVDLGRLWRTSLAVGTAGISESLISAYESLRDLGKAEKEAEENALALVQAQRALERGYLANARAASTYAASTFEATAATQAMQEASNLLALGRKQIQQQDAAGRAYWRQFDEQLAQRRKAAEAINEASGGSGGSAAGPTKALKKYEEQLARFTQRYRDLTDERIAALEREVVLWGDLEAEVSGAFGTSLGDAIQAYNRHLEAIEGFDDAIARAIASGDNEGAVAAAAEKAALGAAEDYVTAWQNALEYNTAVKAKIGEAMAGLLRDNPELKAGARALTSELLSLDPAVADTAITRLVQEGTLGKIAEQLQQAASTNNAISQQFADIFYAAGIASASSAVTAIEAEFETDRERQKLIKAGKKAGQAFGDAFIAEIRASIRQATREANAARSSSSRMVTGSSTALMATPAAGPVQIHVHAAVADPISVGRTVQSVLEKRKLRLGI